MNQAVDTAVRTPEVVELEPRQAAVVHVAGDGSELPSLLGDAFETTMQQIVISGGQVAGPPFARYLGFGKRVEAEVGFPYIGTLVSNERVRAVTLPGGRAVLMTHVGAYEEIRDAWSSVTAWMREEGLEQTSAPWESYLTSPGDPGLPVTQIVFPVR